MDATHLMHMRSSAIVGPSHSSVCLATKPVVGITIHIAIFQIAAMLNATQIVSMPNVSIVCIRNRQFLMFSDFSRNIEFR
jgi:hypothetical protein